MKPKRDISDRVPQALLAVAGFSWFSFLLYLLPWNNETRGALLASAAVCGWICAGASLWACLRIRNRACCWAVALSLPLAVLCGLETYWLASGCGFQPEILFGRGATWVRPPTPAFPAAFRASEPSAIVLALPQMPSRMPPPAAPSRIRWAPETAACPAEPDRRRWVRCRLVL